MALAVAVKVVDITRRRKVVRVTITPSGSYTTGGDILNLTGMSNPNWLVGAFMAALPNDSALCNSPNGYNAEFIPGTTLANGKMKFFSSSGTEIAATTYPAGLSGDPLEYEFSGPLWKF